MTTRKNVPTAWPGICLMGVTTQVSGLRVQAINEEGRHSSRHAPAWTMGAGGDQAPAIASFLNPEPLNPRHLSSCNS